MILTVGAPQEKDGILTIGFISKFRCLVRKDYRNLTIEFSIKTLLLLLYFLPRMNGIKAYRHCFM